MALYDAPLGADQAMPYIAAQASRDPREGLLLIDSGATDHMTGDARLLHDYVPFSTPETINGIGKALAYGVGTIRIESMLNRKEVTCTFSNVLHVGGLPHTLLSLSTMTDKGARFNGQGDYLTVSMGDEPSFYAIKTGRLYAIDSYTTAVVLPRAPAIGMHAAAPREPAEPAGDPVSPGPTLPKLASGMLAEIDARTWHRRYGHAPFSSLLKAKELTTGITTPAYDFRSEAKDPSVCRDCTGGRHTRDSRKSYTPKVTEPLRRLHVDIMGKMGEPSVGGAEYVLTIVDEATRYVCAVPIPTKAAAGDALIITINRWERITKHKVVFVRSDRGGEFTSGKLKAEFESRGITPEFTVAYSPESNGMAERTNRTLLERVRSMMLDSGLPNQYWGEAVVYAAHLINLSASSGINTTPHEAFYGERPDVSCLRTFGCVSYTHIPRKLRATKLEPKDIQGVFLGVDIRSKTHRVLNEGKIQEQRDVICDETQRGWDALFQDIDYDFSSSNYSLACGSNDFQPEESASNGDLSTEPSAPAFTDSNGDQVDALDTFSSDDDEPDAPDGGDAAGTPPTGGGANGSDSSSAAPGGSATPERRYPMRERRPAERFSPSQGYAADLPPSTELPSLIEPKSYREARASPQAEQWDQAMAEEVDALIANAPSPSPSCPLAPRPFHASGSTSSRPPPTAASSASRPAWWLAATGRSTASTTARSSPPWAVLPPCAPCWPSAPSATTSWA
jgi:transposase InsO family protein